MECIQEIEQNSMIKEEEGDVLVSFSKELQALIDSYNRNARRDEEIKNLIKIVEEMDLLKDDESYKQHLIELSQLDENEDITHLYICEKEKRQQVERRLHALQNDYDTMKNNLIREKEDLELDLLQQIEKLRNDIENQKKIYSEREHSLYNELQGSQAAAAVQYDEMETKLQNLLTEANQKWRETNNICNALRNELIRTKQEMSHMISLKQKECQTLQEKLRSAEEKLLNISLAQRVQWQEPDDESTSVKSETPRLDVSVNFYAGGNPLEIRRNVDTSKNAKSFYKQLDVCSDDKSDFVDVERKCVVKQQDPYEDSKENNAFNEMKFHRRTMHSTLTKSDIKKIAPKDLPPLKQVEPAKPGRSAGKKRKLYNVNTVPNIEYM